ncbi:MAG: hypothetical protein JO047_16705 [Alphaproteobacteria bacterium]|nr:hypothetical protein [Alphaproteobacteria bacterium]
MPESRLFERSLSVRRIPAKSPADTGGEITCTYYPDLMIRESGTDTPDPEAAMLVVGAHPACTRNRPPGGVTLATEGYSLLGRMGGFVVFSATDPNGAVPFIVLDAASGRAIYTDGTVANRGFRAAALDHGALHLRYTRGFNASCSLAQDAGGCWAQLVKDGKIPPEMAGEVPPAPRCAAAYQKQHVPADDPSVVFYDMETTLNAGGAARVLSHGAVGCEPMP